MGAPVKAVSEVMASLDRHIAEQSAELALEIRTELIRDTRVDTGFARANWQLTTGSPPTSTVASASDASAIRAIVGYVSPDVPLFVSNRVRYIGMRSRRGAMTVAEASAAVQRAVSARLAVTP